MHMIDKVVEINLNKKYIIVSSGPISDKEAAIIYSSFQDWMDSKVPFLLIDGTKFKLVQIDE